ncbi:MULTISPECIES: 2-phosphosulfolactate phosphatase [Thermus]|uniref:Probable 2-phosphosulfolactate phosphatase n=1 Tax=Thermus brockianus TaxID=56956 RepID=A0A1J0LU66_THEBO|nr:2-phosphosulfolactate phosphatase [Thermus brockianus]APD09768.1 2-phosphosulfolactate phosphatase [Thermus brockianus]BDG16930.1 2-phosphosulfolactate phosphatase [Thermus brockianus]
MCRVDLCLRPSPGPLILVEVLPAGSVLTRLLALGAKGVWVAPGPKVARLLAESLGKEALLLGEVEGFPPEGFHGRLSLLDLEKTEVKGKEAVLVAPFLNASVLPEEREVYLASLRNAKAVVGLAKTLPNPTLRPSGAPEPLLSAVVALGFLQKRLSPEAQSLATALLKAFPDPQEALFQSPEGQALHKEGRTEELAWASLIGVDPVVPRLAETRFFPKETYGLSQNRYAQRYVAWSG